MTGILCSFFFHLAQRCNSATWWLGISKTDQMWCIWTNSSLLSKTFLNALTCCAHLALSTAPHLIGRQREDGDGVPTLHLSHHRVLTHSSQQLHAVYRWRKGIRALFIKRCWLNLWLWMRNLYSHLSKMRLVSVLLYRTSCLNSWRQRKTHISTIPGSDI